MEFPCHAACASLGLPAVRSQVKVDLPKPISRPINCRGAHLDSLPPTGPPKESRVRRMHARILLGSVSNVGIRDFVVADSILRWLVKYPEFQGPVAGPDTPRTRKY